MTWQPWHVCMTFDPDLTALPQVEGLEVVVAVNEPPPAPTSTTGSRDAAATSPSSALPNSSVSSSNRLCRTGHLVVGLYGIEVGTQAEPPPANVLQGLAPLDSAFSDAQSAPAGDSPCGDGGVQMPEQERPDLPQLQRLLRRGLSPSSTAPDLLALAASSAPALGVAAGICPGGSDGVPGDANGPGCSAIHVTDKAAAGAKAVLDVVEQAFLYAHWQLRAHDLRAAYVPPPPLPPASFQPSGSSPGREPTSARVQQTQQQDELLRPLLPCGMGLCGVYSRSRAPLDGTAPKQYVRLGLSGLSGALCASQLAELQRIGGLIGSGDAAAETQESKLQRQQQQQEEQEQRQDRPVGPQAASAERTALEAGVSAGDTASPSGPRIAQRLSYADAVRAPPPSDAASASALQRAPSRGPHSPSIAPGTPLADALDLPRFPSTSSPSSSSLSSSRGPALARTSSAMLRLPLLAPTTVVQLAIAPLNLTYVANESSAEQPAPAQPTDRGGGSSSSSSGSSVAPPFTLGVRASRPVTVALTTGPAGNTTSVQLHSLELHSPCVQQQQQQHEHPARPPGMVLRLLSLGRTLCIKSISVELRRPGGGSGMAVWGSLCGLRLLGQLPSSFLLSNGAGQDDARVLFRYWGAGAEPPALPEAPPEGATGAREAQPKVLTQECAGGDEGVLPDGCGDGGGGGLELVVSDLAVGLGFLTALPAALSSGDKPPAKDAAGAAEQKQPKEQERGVDGDAHAPVQQARRRRPSTPRARVGAKRGGAESGWPHAGSAAVRESPFATSQRAAEADADAPSGGDVQIGLAFGSSGGAADGECTDEEDAGEDLSAQTPGLKQEQEQAQGEPFWTRVRLSNCCVLALGPSRTPFAAASGSGHQACNALLLLESATLTSPPPLPPPPAHQTPPPPTAPAAAAPASLAGVAHASPEAFLVEQLGVGEDHTHEQPHVSHASRPRSGQQLEVEGLVVYLADNPDSAYLSPVVLLPSLTLRHLPASDSDTNDDGNSSSSGHMDSDSDRGVDTPRVGRWSGRGASAAAAVGGADKDKDALEAMSPEVNLQVRSAASRQRGIAAVMILARNADW